jgi:hypothetical protein
VARIRAAEGRPECLATAPPNHLRASGRRDICGGDFCQLRASALRPQADGVTGAGFALTVKVFARFTDRPINGKC